MRDLLRLRSGDIPRVPDVVVYPGSEEEVQLVVDRAVAANAVLIPFGGGSNISGSLQAPPDETRPVISVDMGRMNRVLSVDEESGLARIQAGVLGPDLEAQLGARAGPSATSRTASPTARWAAGSRPAPRACSRTSTATSPRSPAAYAWCSRARCWSLRPLPSTSTGPSVREMILGSEGRLGIITEVTVQVHRIPEERLILGYLFPSWDAGLAAMQEISDQRRRPTITRVSDGRETRFSFATRKKSSGCRSPHWSARA